MMSTVIVFFFSSRRRHTRCLSDWSSDVCSSDLYDIAKKVEREWPENARDLKGKIHLIVGTADTFHLDESARDLQQALEKRSEERRVGKECRSRWATEQ